VCADVLGQVQHTSLRTLIPALAHVLNTPSIPEKVIYKVPHAVPVSAHHKWNFDDLLEKMRVFFSYCIFFFFFFFFFFSLFFPAQY
jgi:hypothetical protein